MTGDGLDLAAEFEAKLVDMEQIKIHPSQAAGSKILITEAVRGNGAICVNRAGKRFMNELHHGRRGQCRDPQAERDRPPFWYSTRRSASRSSRSRATSTSSW